jgi:hypothetical protein
MTKAVIFVLFTLLFCSTGLRAQNSLFDTNDLSNVKIDNYSDDELISFYNKAIESGISELQLYKMASNRGLAESEVIKLKKRLQFINPGKRFSSKENSKEQDTDEAHSYDTSEQKPQHYIRV